RAAVRQRILGKVQIARFSPDGRHVLTVAPDVQARLDGVDLPFTPVRLWDAATGREVLGFQGHDSAVATAEFSLDGQRVLTAETARASIYHADPQGTRSGGAPTREHTAARIWDVASGKQLGALQGHEGPITSAAFSPDGRLVVTTSEFHSKAPAVH